jgi:hypothetical protein
MSDISNAVLLNAITSAHEATAMLAQHMEARFNFVDARFNAVDARFDGVDSRLDRLERRVTNLEDTTAVGFRLIDTRLSRLEQQRTA